MSKTYSIKEISDMAGISKRTMHYYDEIGLLEPEFKTESNYRRYTAKDLEKLWIILYLKELDFSLQDIKSIIDSQKDIRFFLESHKDIIVKKKNRLENIITSINKTLVEGFDVNMLKAFDERKYDEYKKEVIGKYGDIARKSYEKTDSYSTDKWDEINTQLNNIFISISKNMDKDVSNDIVQDLIKGLQSHITEYYYDCKVEILRGLGEMYVGDERFKNNIDSIQDGLAEYVRKAINYYCDNN